MKLWKIFRRVGSATHYLGAAYGEHSLQACITACDNLKVSKGGTYAIPEGGVLREPEIAAIKREMGQ